jgi:hypothetical protein
MTVKSACPLILRDKDEFIGRKAQVFCLCN